MRIIYLGAEVGSNRTILESMGVANMGVSYARMVKRGMPKTKQWLIADRFDSAANVVAFPGVTETKNFSKRECEEFAADYQDWIVDNIDRLSGFVEFDPPQLGQAWVEQQRTFFADAGDLFWPVWNTELGPNNLVRLAKEYGSVAVPYGASMSLPTHQITGQMRSLSANYDATFHGIGIASPEALNNAPLKTASTLSWTSPMRRGETIVWDGTRLVRYPKKMKDQARPRYKAIIEKAGLDYAAIMADDAKELTKLAIWSYQRLEEHMDKKKPTTNPFQVIQGGGEGGDGPRVPSTDVDNTLFSTMDLSGMLFGDVDNKAIEVRKQEAVEIAPRDPMERQFLPVLGVSTKTVVEPGPDGRDTVREVPILSSTGTSLRQCDTCFVASNCPAYRPSTECAFSLPVEVKTKDQLVALLNATIEMQGARVAFARFAEELNGGYPDPNTGQEIDRLFKLVEQMKKLEDNREFVRMTFERQGGAGVLSSIFGDRAQVLRELDGGGMNAQQTNQIIQQSLD